MNEGGSRMGSKDEYHKLLIMYLCVHVYFGSFLWFRLGKWFSISEPDIIWL